VNQNSDVVIQGEGGEIERKQNLKVWCPLKAESQLAKPKVANVLTKKKPTQGEKSS